MKIFGSLLLFILFFNQLLFAQNFYTKVATETCNCIESKSSKNLSAKQIEIELGICMMTGISKYKTDYDKEFEMKSIQEIDMEKLGETVGLEMMSICPHSFLGFLGDHLENENQENLKIELGKIKSIESKQFNTLNLEIGDGSILKFLWLWDFNGSELLIQQNFKDKWVNIFYSEVPIFDPKTSKYIQFKVIEGIELGE